MQTLERLIQIAELATRSARAVRELRRTGNEAAARVLEQECNRACNHIVRTAARRRQAAARARRQPRGTLGQFVR